MKLSNLLKKQKHLKKSKAFTLIELIVVITIIAILGTIAFIALQGYTQNSRDSKRISDINSIQKSLEIYISEKGTYPIPDEFSNITYSGATAWIEGTVGDKVIKNLDKINKKPLDPLTGNEYTYSVTSGKTEYQIGTISESGQMGYKLPINQTHASNKSNAKAMIRGNYNERFLKVQSGTLNWILALPSIIATDITQPEIQTILDNKKLVYNNYANIPHSYNNYGYTMTGGFEYTNPNPLIYSGSTKILAEDNNEKLLFVDSLKEAYNGTILQGEPNYQDIVNADTENNETGAINLINNFINTNVGGLKSGNFTLPITETPQIPPTPPTIYNCTGTLITGNATITNNTGLTSTTNYQPSTPENKCYYECINGYEGTDCENIITYTVTFDARGGTGNTPTTKTVNYNTEIGTLPTEPTKVGYIFNGWFTEITGGEELIETTIISANITYYAQWGANTNTIIFNGNGNTGGATANQTIASDTTANLTANGYTKTGYTFAGWSTTSTGIVEYANQASYTMGTSSVTLYAKWTTNTYTVSGGFGSYASGATIDVCGTNTTADSSGNFTTIRDYLAVCNTITAERTGYTCNTTTNGPASLTTNITNITGNCTINTYTVSGGFGSYASGATIDVCGTNTTADSSGNFISTRNHGDVCNNITTTRTGYTCSTTTNGPASLTTNTTNITGNCTINTYTVSGGFGSYASGATIDVCGTNTTADSSGNFTSTRNYGAVCNAIIATRTNYTCNTTTNGPASLTSNTTNIAGSCALIQTYQELGLCNLPDIVVQAANGYGPYTIASCNLGSTIAGTSSTSYGRLFKWGDNNGRNPTSSLANYIPYINGVAGTQINSTDFNSTTIGDSIEGGPNRWPRPNTFIQGPCPTGYHVPSVDDWTGIMVSGGRAFVGAQGVIISNDLKLPWSGYRNTSGLISGGGTFGAYWTTNLSLSNAGYQLFMNANLSPGLNPQDRNQALSIRCFKN